MRMAKSRRRDTWTEIGRATGPAWSRAQRQSYSERGTDKSRWRVEGPGEAHFTLKRSGGLPSPTSRTFQKPKSNKPLNFRQNLKIKD